MSVITYLVFNGASAVVDIVTISQYIHNIVVPQQGNVMFLFGLFDKILNSIQLYPLLLLHVQICLTLNNV